MFDIRNLKNIYHRPCPPPSSLLTWWCHLFYQPCDRPFLEPVKALIGQLDLFQHKLHLGESSAFITMLSKALILLLLFDSSFCRIGRKVLFHRLSIQWGDSVFHKVPYINKIYKAFQDVIRSLFSSSSKSFNQWSLFHFKQWKFFHRLVTCERSSYKI